MSKENLSMYYDRTLSDEFAEYLLPGGKLRWLFDFVKNHPELDFGLVRNKYGERIILYRGLTKIMDIKNAKMGQVYVDGTKKYKEFIPELYGKKAVEDIKKEPIEKLIEFLSEDEYSARYYDSKKEGYYQNELSRKYGINAADDAEFVIVDKEVVIGYVNDFEKENELGPIKEEYNNLYKELRPQITGRDYKDEPANDSNNKSKKNFFGDELDFLVLNKKGDILLIEVKYGKDTQKIYWSPLQIGVYYDILTKFPKLEERTLSMLKQRQELGLISPNWTIQDSPRKKIQIIPVLIVAGPKHSLEAEKRLYKVLEKTRAKKGTEFLKDLQIFGYETDKGLIPW